MSSSTTYTTSDNLGEAVVPVLACVLNQLCQRNDSISNNSTTDTKFSAQRYVQYGIICY